MSETTFQCPGCKTMILVPASLQGFWVNCPNCGTGFAALNLEQGLDGSLEVDTYIPGGRRIPPFVVALMGGAIVTVILALLLLASRINHRKDEVGKTNLNQQKVSQFADSRKNTTATLSPVTQFAARGEVLDFLRGNVNDANSLEVVEWGPVRRVLLHETPAERPLLKQLEEAVKDQTGQPAPVPTFKYSPATIMQLKYRTKNAFGAKVIVEEYFFIEKNGIRSVPIRTENHAGMIVDGLRNVPVSVERTDGKLTKAIVRGAITFNGQPARIISPGAINSLGNRERIFMILIPLQDLSQCELHADLVPPRFEIWGVPPGTYRVSLEWNYFFENWQRLGERIVPDLPTEGDRLRGRYKGDASPIVFEVDDKNETQEFRVTLEGDDLERLDSKEATDKRLRDIRAKPPEGLGIPIIERMQKKQQAKEDHLKE